MIGSVGPGDSTSKITLSEFSSSKELMEKELEARAKRKYRPPFVNDMFYIQVLLTFYWPEEPILKITDNYMALNL